MWQALFYSLEDVIMSQMDNNPSPQGIYILMIHTCYCQRHIVSALNTYKEWNSREYGGG